MSARRRGFIEAVILRLLLLRPFRCSHCDARHYELFFRPLRAPVPSPVPVNTTLPPPPRS